jgi:prolipoprotein diacylglyceryltransferase
MSYWIFMAIAIVVSIYVIYKNTTMDMFSAQYNTIVQMIIIGFIGAFLFSYLELILMQHAHTGSWTLVPFTSTRRWFAALFCGLLFLYFKEPKRELLNVLDVVVLAVCIGIPIGKLGCYFDGHFGCYGIPTNLPWGKIFTNGTYSSVVKVHPIQLYDAIFHTILFFILLFAKNKMHLKTGIVFVSFMTITSIYNFFMELISTDEIVVLKMTFAQFIYVLIAIFSILIYVTNIEKQPRVVHQQEHNNK